MKTVSEIPEIQRIVDAGFSIADATISATTPQGIGKFTQLTLNF